MTDKENYFKPLEIIVGNNDFEGAFRRFKMLVQKEKIIATYKEKQTYEKPSIKKRRKAREATAKRMMAESRERQIISGEFEKKQKARELKRQRKVAARG